MPRRKERGPWFWRGAIALMLTSVFGLFAAAAMLVPKQFLVVIAAFAATTGVYWFALLWDVPGDRHKKGVD